MDQKFHSNTTILNNMGYTKVIFTPNHLSHHNNYYADLIINRNGVEDG